MVKSISCKEVFGQGDINYMKKNNIKRCYLRLGIGGNEAEIEFFGNVQKSTKGK